MRTHIDTTLRRILSRHDGYAGSWSDDLYLSDALGCAGNRGAIAIACRVERHSVGIFDRWHLLAFSRMYLHASAKSQPKICLGLNAKLGKRTGAGLRADNTVYERRPQSQFHGKAPRRPIA